MSQVCIIGLDGGTFKIIDYLVEQGRLPNFSNCMNRGSRAILKSTVPPVTPAAWSSFSTGTNPGKTGVVDFFRWAPGKQKLSPINAGNVQGKPIWKLISDAGQRVCVYNVPVTYPAAAVNGVLLSGMDAPSVDEWAIYPGEFAGPLRDAIPDFAVNPDIDSIYLANNHPDPSGAFNEQLRAFLDMELRTINFLFDKEEWDLFVAVIRSTDIYQHQFMSMVENVISREDATAQDERRAEFVFSCYEEIDKVLGRICAVLDSRGGQLVVMSDHGFTRWNKQVSLNRALADAGLLKFRQPAERQNIGNSFKKRIFRRIPQKRRAFIKRMLGRGEEFWMDKHADLLTGHIDWEKTRACVVGQFGCLYVNLKSLRPLGIVEDEKERLEVLDRVEAALRELVDDDGIRVVTRFQRREDVYNGPLMDQLPDMVLQLRESYHGLFALHEAVQKEPIVPPVNPNAGELSLTGTHTEEGILIMCGANIKKADLRHADIVDIAPTVLDLLGYSVPDNCDGRILADAFIGENPRRNDNSPAANSYETGPPPVNKEYSDDDEEEIRKRLENLGYL